MFHDFRELFSHLGKFHDRSFGSQEWLKRLKRVATVGAGLGDRFCDSRETADLNVIADFDVPGNAGVSA